MRRSLPFLPLSALVLGALPAVLLPACSEDGATPDCPAVPRYDIGAAGERNDAEDERKAAVAAGCQTDIYGSSGTTP
jgi:hypothetical protein